MKWEEVWGGAYLKDHAAAPRTVHCPCSDEKVIMFAGMRFIHITISVKMRDTRLCRFEGSNPCP